MFIFNSYFNFFVFCRLELNWQKFVCRVLGTRQTQALPSALRSGTRQRASKMFFNSLPSTRSRALGKADPTLGKEPTQTLNHATSHSTPHLSIRAPLPIHTRRRFSLATTAALLHAAGRAPHQRRQAPPPPAFSAASFVSRDGSPPPLTASPRPRHCRRPPRYLPAASTPPPAAPRRPASEARGLRASTPPGARGRDQPQGLPLLGARGRTIQPRRLPPRRRGGASPTTLR